VAYAADRRHPATAPSLAVVVAAPCSGARPGHPAGKDPAARWGFRGGNLRPTRRPCRHAGGTGPMSGPALVGPRGRHSGGGRPGRQFRVRAGHGVRGRDPDRGCRAGRWAGHGRPCWGPGPVHRPRGRPGRRAGPGPGHAAGVRGPRHPGPTGRALNTTPTGRAPGRVPEGAEAGSGCGSRRGSCKLSTGGRPRLTPQLLEIDPQSLTHRLHRLPAALQHQPTQVQPALDPLVLAPQRVEHLGDELVQLCPHLLDLTLPHAARLTGPNTD
jgi:hypothetical protein